MRRRTAFVLSLAGLLATLAAIGYWMLFSHFATYDDEGYILISARQYFAHGKLYEGVYSQYGPAFYFLMDILQRVFGPVDHAFARWLTLVFWVGTAVCCGGITWRQTTSRALTFFTISAVFLFLYFITDEPFHPGSLIFFLLSASLWAATELIGANKWTRTAFATGSSGAVLLLTKINVGIFFMVAVAAWAISHTASVPLRRFSRPWLMVFLTGFAALLMHTLIHETWVQIYLLLFGCGVISLITTIRTEGVVTGKFWSSTLFAGLIASLVVLGSIWLRGTSLHGLLDGVLLGPLRHPGNYSYPVDWRPGSLTVTALSLGLACSLSWLEKKYSREFVDRLIMGLRLLVAAGLLVGIAALVSLRAVGAIFSFVAPLIWIFAAPLSTPSANPQARASRTLLALVLLLQYLHAYPVGGAQESWGSFLFIPLVAVGLGDVRIWFSASPRAPALKRVGWGFAASVLMAVTVAKTAWSAHRAYRDYHSRVALNLPGATQLRLPALSSASYQILALNAVVHTDMLFSTPGMFSFNLWTSLPPPTDKNTTLWFSLLSETEQQEIIHQLEANPRAGIIEQNSLVELMRANEIPMKGPLWDYIHHNFQTAFKSEGFAFQTRNGRSITPLNIATVRPRSDQDSAVEPRYNAQLDFSTVHEGPPITWIDLTVGAASTETLRLDQQNARVSAARVTRDGGWISAPVEVPWPVEATGLVHLTIRFVRDNFIFPPAETLLILRGAHDENLGEIRIAE